MSETPTDGSAATDKIRSVLKEPFLLNLVCGLFALERTYDLLLKQDKTDIHAWGHFVVVLVYTVGFCVGVWGVEQKPPSEWCRQISLGLVILGSILLLVFVGIDVCKA